jgi:hypothetical protein
MSYLNESKEKQRMRGLSYGGQITTQQNGQVMGNGYKYTNIQGTSITSTMIGQQT